METKQKSENEQMNLEMVVGSISEDLRGNAAITSKLVTSVETLSGKIKMLTDIINELDRDPDELKELKDEVDQIRKAIEQRSMSEIKLMKMPEAFDRTSNLQERLVESKVVHHHHIPKVIWIAAGLFILLSLESAGWLNTRNKLDQYIANDTKYRFLRLDTTAKSLKVYLDSLDASYKTHLDMRERVISLEEENQENLERLEKAERLKQEARDLENRVLKK